MNTASGRSAARRTGARFLQAMTGKTQGKRGLYLGWSPVLGQERSKDLAGFEMGFLTGTEGAGVFSSDLSDVSDDSYDVVVLEEVLDRVESPEGLVESVHKILSDTGAMVVLARHGQKSAPARKLAQLMGLSDESTEVTHCFSSRELFETVKNGFDVEQFQTFGRFFTVFLEYLADFSIRWKEAKGSSNTAAADRSVRGWVYPLQVLASPLDLVLVFSKGYYIVARCKKRPWRQRKTPVLRDGRSIADAALNTKIGSAGPF